MSCPRAGPLLRGLLLAVGLIGAACTEESSPEFEQGQARLEPKSGSRAREAGQHRGHGETRRDPQGGDLRAQSDTTTRPS